jgi:cytochrome c oxidase subunit I+III
MTMALGGSEGRPISPVPEGGPLYPQSRGADGLERLDAAWAPPRRFAFFTEVNNTHIGVIYITTGFLFFLGAGVLSLLMRVQLAYPT